ncbi:D-Ala-D-Ala carboxypeptidase family metallohydrolase [Ruegeria sp. SCPT10]|uniref:YcbK family protein n=1 Tax=Ruegeria sp. SCP10 TaxID=3141377 RepID=UPI003336159C
MNAKLQNLLDIAKLVLPPIGALIDDDDGEQIAKDVADIVEAAIGHLEPEQQKKLVQEDPKLQAELKVQIEEVANRMAEAENRAFEAMRSEELESKRNELASEQHTHEQELAEFQKTLEDTEAARAHADTAALSDRWWVSGINPLLSFIIVIAFFMFLALIAQNPIGKEVLVNVKGEVINPEDVRFNEESEMVDAEGDPIVRRITGNNLEVFYIAFGAMATAFVTVVGFHFGSSYGSKRKTKLQRLYGTRGILSANAAAPAGAQAASATGGGTGVTGSFNPHPVESAVATIISGKSNLHPFELFWTENLSHIQHFNWRELLEKGTNNTGVGLNTDPPRELYQNVVPLVNALDRIRKELGAPIQLISVYRSPEYNRHVGGATSSRHMQFDAADFRVLGGGAGNSGRWSKVAKKLRSTGAFRGGVGIYPTFVHIDTRGKNADWDER